MTFIQQIAADRAAGKRIIGTIHHGGSVDTSFWITSIHPINEHEAKITYTHIPSGRTGRCTISDTDNFSWQAFD